MTLLILEALGALLLLVLIVWWTMFSGRSKGEIVEPSTPAPAPVDHKAAKQNANEQAADTLQS